MNLTRYRRWTALISAFLAGQGSVQVLSLISGFLLLRWLSVEAYAQYSVAFGFQVTLGVLVDLGFSGSIVALVGDRGSDKEVVGSYVRSAKHFRNRFFAVIIPLAAIAFPLVASKHNWDWTTQLLLFVSIVSSLFFQGWASYYTAPLLINQQLKQFYQPQIAGAFARILLCFILYLMSALSAWTTAWINSAVMAFNGLLYRRATIPWMIEPRNSNPQVNREMLRYISPLIPVLSFCAFQGQISLALITIFGQTKSIAEIAALGRLSQLFVILGAFNGVIVEPYMAKVARANLTKKYFQILGATLIIALLLSAIAFLFPQPLIWVLGSKYQSLKAEVGWVITTSSFNYVSNALNAMNSGSKFIYWWASAFEIALIIIIQISCIFVMDLSTTINVVYFSLIVAVAYSVLHFLIGSYGLIQNQLVYGQIKK